MHVDAAYGRCGEHSSQRIRTEGAGGVNGSQLFEAEIPGEFDSEGEA